MQNHEITLQNLCRICGSNIILKHGYRTAKSVENHANIIYSVYDIDTVQEPSNVYPKFLCGNCNRKLLRFEKQIPPITKQEPATYTRHDINCSVCTLSSKNNELHIKLLDERMMQYGFLKSNVINPSFKRIYLLSVLESEIVQNKSVLFLEHSNKWHCQIYGKSLSVEHLNLPEYITDDTMHNFIDVFCNLSICEGIKGFTDVIANRLEPIIPFPTEKGQPAAFLEDHNHAQLITDNFKIIRHNKCTYICDSSDSNNLCSNCSYYCNFLRSCRSRITLDEPERKKQRTSDSSKSNYRFLSRQELEERLANAQKSKREAIRKSNRMSSLVNELISKDGVVVDNDQHEAFSEIMCKSSCDFEEDSPQWLLWQQQRKQLQKKDSRGMRWHPLIIRWCLSLHYTSAAAYRQLTSKKLNFLRLPHVDTLRKYAQFTTPTSGFNPDVIVRLADEAKLETIKEYQKNVVLSYDEMQIKSDLVYRKSTGQMIGFTDMGDINEEFRLFQSEVETSESSNELNFSYKREFATHVVVYMVRGIFSNLCYPFGYFASLGLSSAQMYPCTIEATRVLTALGFYVRAYVSDGASPNRKLYKIMVTDDVGNIHWTWMPINPNNKIYFISDPPHLLKTTRNCFENSDWNKNTRNLHLDGQDISWKHIVDVYEWDLGLNRAAPGLRKLHKLTEEHVKLSPRLRMKVNLAAQVLSDTTSKALESHGQYDTHSTQKFVKMIDRVFDCLNVSKINKGRFGKRELAVYTSIDDWRFKFLEEDFLQNYIDRWEDQANANVGMTQEEKNRLLLSKQTQHGWRMSVKSFVAVAKELLVLDDVNFLLSEKFTQDPLEEHFARQRRRGGCNENPNYYQFQNQELILNVMQSELITDLKGNTRGRDQGQKKIDIHDMRRLPTKKNNK